MLITNKKYQIYGYNEQNNCDLNKVREFQWYFEGFNQILIKNMTQASIT